MGFDLEGEEGGGNQESMDAMGLPGKTEKKAEFRLTGGDIGGGFMVKALGDQK